MVTSVVACSESDDGNNVGDVNDDNNDDNNDDPVVVRVAARTSRGATIAIDEDRRTLAVANKATNNVTLFNLSDLSVRTRIDVGAEPVSVTFSPDGTRLYVVNRGDKTVSIIEGVEGASPTVRSTVAVGSEPTAGALSPTGATLYVANWADGTMSVVDTAAGTVRRTVELGGAPFAVCVSNDLDQEDGDEYVYVTDFYSRPIARQKEATDGSREGRVFRVLAGDYSVQAIRLPPLLVKGIEPAIDAANTEAFPNQLYACNVNRGAVYVSSVGASPAAFEGGTDFRQNIHGLVHVIDEATAVVDQQKTVNLSELVAALQGEKRFAAVPHDIAFVDNSELAYLPIMTANAVLRVDFSANPPVAGSPSGANFLTTDASPTGIVIDGSTAYVYNEVGRSVTQLNLAAQATVGDPIESQPLPVQGSDEAVALRGQRFFNTGLARWSTGAWVGCVGCHPFGTTDNVTWVFPAGPRQTVDTSASFDVSGDVQRIFNWTAIFDEVHDFELNTRGVANGVGAVVTSTGIDVANRLNFVGAGGVGNPENGFNVGSVKQFNEVNGVLTDWDEIEEFVATIRAPAGRTAPSDAIQRGRDVFEEANCANCHGGVLWTLSERYYTPLLNGDLRNLTFEDAGVTSIGAVAANLTVLDDLGFAATPLINNDSNGAPQRHLCVVRQVGTFAAPGPDNRGADEIRQNGNAAQGVDGFNVPSLLNVNTGAPFLHNGAAESLEVLLDPNGQFTDHLIAGNQVFSPTADQISDLIAFVRSIDDTTEIFPTPAGQQLCPTGVVPPVISDQ